MKKRIAAIVLGVGCLMAPSCLDQGLLGFGLGSGGFNLCVPVFGGVDYCTDINTPVDGVVSNVLDTVTGG